MSFPEPTSQQKTLNKREEELRRAIAKMEPVGKLQRAAERLRAAQLLKAKAQFEIIRYREDPNSKRMKAIERRCEYWRGISVEAILILYAN